jgi:hypothetical protein
LAVNALSWATSWYCGPQKKPLFIIGVSHGSYRLEEALPFLAGALPRLFSTWPPDGFMKDLAVW